MLSCLYNFIQCCVCSTVVVQGFRIVGSVYWTGIVRSVYMLVFDFPNNFVSVIESIIVVKFQIIQCIIESLILLCKFCLYFVVDFVTVHGCVIGLLVVWEFYLKKPWQYLCDLVNMLVCYRMLPCVCLYIVWYYLDIQVNCHVVSLGSEIPLYAVLIERQKCWI